MAPKDKVLEEDQYKTEAGIHGALNGLYRQLISTSLYGANLSQTALDAMGHFYTYPPSQPSGNKLSATLFFLCNGRSEEYGAAESIFADIWKSGYNTLLNINYFLKSMEGSTAVIGSNNKDVLMGEAYGLRAYLHFDLFRLFGPRWEDRSNINKILPYSRTTDMILNHVGYEEDVYSTADEYLDYLLEDIREAERLLAADPILSDDSAISKELISDFYKNRNRRMNYYAVKALEARVLQYIGDYKNAAIAAKVVTDQIGEKGKVIARGLDALSEVFLKIVGLLMYYAPIGLGAYFAALIGEHGKELLGSYARAMVVYYPLCLVYMFTAFPLYAWISGGMEGVRRLKYVVSPAVTAVATQSSIATLPVNLEACEKIGVPKDIREIILPIGATAHMDGTVLSSILKISFLFGIFQVPFEGAGTYASALLLSIAGGVVMSGVPGGGLIGEMFIVTMYGFPAEAFPFLSTIGYLVDPLARMIIASGDTIASMLVTRVVEGKDWLKKQLS